MNPKKPLPESAMLIGQAENVYKAVTIKEIANCPVPEDGLCPKRWDQMAVIAKDQRYCEHCEKVVHRVRTRKALLEKARQGMCVAYTGR